MVVINTVMTRGHHQRSRNLSVHLSTEASDSLGEGNTVVVAARVKLEAIANQKTIEDENGVVHIVPRTL